MRDDGAIIWQVVWRAFEGIHDYCNWKVYLFPLHKHATVSSGGSRWMIAPGLMKNSRYSKISLSIYIYILFIEIYLDQFRFLAPLRAQMCSWKTSSVLSSV